MACTENLVCGPDLDGLCINGVCISRSNMCSMRYDPTKKVLLHDKSILYGPFKDCSPSFEEESCKLTCIPSNTMNGSCIVMDDHFTEGLTCGTFAIGKPIGVCSSAGDCSMELCRLNRCYSHGNCIRNVNGFVDCDCDEGYSGEFCNFSLGGKTDRCGILNGDGSSCKNQLIITSTKPAMEFIKSKPFLTIVLPTIFGVLLIILLFVWRFKRKKPVVRSFKTAFPIGGDYVNVFTSDHALRDPPPVPQLQFIKESSDVRRPTFNNVTQVKNQPPLLVRKSSERHNRSHTSPVTDDEILARVIASHEYIPQLADEMEMLVGDIILVITEYDDGWSFGYNTRTGIEGAFPGSFVSYE